MHDTPVARDDLFRQLPSSQDINHAVVLRDLIRKSDRKVMVLDDDPTGTQTVHDIPVVTRWSVRHLAHELTDPAPASYVLTNSRSLPADQAVALNREIGKNLREARGLTGRDFTLISRSDSTLRGHFPEELDALSAGLQETFDSWVVYTSRVLFGGGAKESLLIGQTVSQAIVDLVRSILVRPRLLIAKGGITSSDVATKGCGVERATVLGQVLPGVPVWRCGPESRLHDLPLVVFPGNVGDVDALTTLIESWRG
jgi:uncharacterized protein YgbK (DUF1537 family)